MNIYIYLAIIYIYIYIYAFVCLHSCYIYMCVHMDIYTYMYGCMGTHACTQSGGRRDRYTYTRTHMYVSAYIETSVSVHLSFYHIYIYVST